jgi:plasmid stabilization system protein ParE
MTLNVRQTAREDILNAARFYEKQELGLGDRVADFLEKEILSLLTTGGIHPFSQGLYRAVVKGDFPYYVIYYSLELDVIHVRAVLDHRRNPRKLSRRLREV